MIAAFITHYLATTRNRKSELLKFQIQSYSDFLAAASRLAITRRLGDVTNKNIDLATLNDAKSRIITCGEPEVVKSLIRFWDKGATLEREQEILAYRTLTQIMRSSLGHRKNDILDLGITDALFKLEPSNASYRAESTAKVSLNSDD